MYRLWRQKTISQPTFNAETLKYFYLASATDDEFNFDDYLFNTEAHPFKKSHFDKEKAKTLPRIRVDFY